MSINRIGSVYLSRTFYYLDYVRITLYRFYTNTFVFLFRIYLAPRSTPFRRLITNIILNYVLERWVEIFLYEISCPKYWSVKLDFYLFNNILFISKLHVWHRTYYVSNIDSLQHMAAFSKLNFCLFFYYGFFKWCTSW